MASTARRVSDLTVGAMPYFWVNPRATNLAFNFSHEPSIFSLTLNTHLQVTIFVFGGGKTSFQVLLPISALISVSTASFHNSPQTGSFTDSR